MSDHDAAPDPLDKAYARSEALLEDEAARAARRERVLAAVASQGRSPGPAAAPRQRFSWARGGWLAAASVAGIATLVALRVDPPPVQPQAQPPAGPPAAAATAPEIAAAPRAEPELPGRSVAASTPIVTPPPSPPAPVAAPRTESRAAPQVAAAPAAPPLPRSVASAPAAAPSAAASSSRTEELAVTGSRVASGPAEARAAQAETSAAPAVRGATIRAAAAAGRIPELRTLLRQGGDVDAVDERGETALMKAVQANQPAAAALLRRQGADLDLKNRAGVSARDMARAIADPELDRALGLTR